MIAKVCRGFVYAVSLMGITGARDQVSGMAAELVGRVRACTGLPLAVGLGVRDGAQAAEVAGFADGVIVGSAFVQRLLDGAGSGRRRPRGARAGRGPGRGRPPPGPRARLSGRPAARRRPVLTERIRSGR